ncbi:MAG: HAD family hydrolase [Gammaproteobacteria bacterium]|nr:HAD family hydrolase [Gammaproteobacteria bacterium]
MATIAVVFDFDDTLVPDSTTALLEQYGVDPGEFWGTLAPVLVREGYDPPLAYLRLILDRVGADRPFGRLSNDDLREFGASLDRKFFPGLPSMFVDLKGSMSQFRDVGVEFYIISGGLQEVIAGSQVVQDHFDGFYDCELGAGDDGVLRHVKRCVTFTEKTRFLFEISKGIRVTDSRTNPHLVNQELPRRIPFQHMIYVGDGLTDIPCFSLVRERGGRTFGDLSRNKTAKQAFQELLQTRRVDSLHSPDYREEADLGAFIRAAVFALATSIELDSEQF